MRYALAAAMSAALAVGAEAASLPPIVQSAIKEARASCAPDPTRIGKNFLRTQDVNGDGEIDYILDYQDVKCATGGRFNCGSSGCLAQVFVSTPDGYVKALDENVQDLKFRKLKGRPAMLLGLHGSSCGKAGFEPCGSTLYWNGSQFSPAN